MFETIFHSLEKMTCFHNGGIILFVNFFYQSVKNSILHYIKSQAELHFRWLQSYKFLFIILKTPFLKD